MRDNKLGCLGFVLVVFLIIGVIIFSASANYNEHTYTVTITDKELKCLWKLEKGRNLYGYCCWV